MAKNINKLPNDYFPHDFNARQDRKILRLRKVLGVEGYGIYWMLIETLATEENFSYPIEDLDLLADSFVTSKEKVNAVVKQFGLFEIDSQAKFFSLSLVARMQKYLDISEKARQNINKRWEKARELKKLNTPVLPPKYEVNTIIGKDIKEKKREDKILPLFSYWNSVLYTPKLLEKEFISELAEKFGEAKTKRIIREFKENNFHKLKTMKDSLNEKGNIKSKNKEPEKYYNTDPLAGIK